MGKVEVLRDIWDQIPKVESNEIELSQKELIKKYVDLFHFGEYFYVIFNTKTTEMEFVSPEIHNVLACSPAEFNLTKILSMLHPDDSPYYYHYEKSAVKFFSGLPIEHLNNYKFSYDYRVSLDDHQTKRILQQIIPLHYFSEGGARTLAIFTDLTHLNIQGTPKLSFIGMNGAPSYYNVHLNEEFFPTNQRFSNKENEILKLVVQGLTSDKIAQKLNRSIHTIRVHRKNILEKSGCANLQELIVKSIREGWV